MVVVWDEKLYSEYPKWVFEGIEQRERKELYPVVIKWKGIVSLRELTEKVGDLLLSVSKMFKREVGIGVAYDTKDNTIHPCTELIVGYETMLTIDTYLLTKYLLPWHVPIAIIHVHPHLAECEECWEFCAYPSVPDMVTTAYFARSFSSDFAMGVLYSDARKTFSVVLVKFTSKEEADEVIEELWKIESKWNPKWDIETKLKHVKKAVSILEKHGNKFALWELR